MRVERFVPGPARDLGPEPISRGGFEAAIQVFGGPAREASLVITRWRPDRSLFISSAAVYPIVPPLLRRLDTLRFGFQLVVFVILIRENLPILDLCDCLCYVYVSSHLRLYVYGCIVCYVLTTSVAVCVVAFVR